jgi:hypothetical protein
MGGVFRGDRSPAHGDGGNWATAASQPASPSASRLGGGGDAGGVVVFPWMMCEGAFACVVECRRHGRSVGCLSFAAASLGDGGLMEKLWVSYLGRVKLRYIGAWIELMDWGGFGD